MTSLNIPGSLLTEGNERVERRKTEALLCERSLIIIHHWPKNTCFRREMHAFEHLLLIYQSDNIISSKLMLHFSVIYWHDRFMQSMHRSLHIICPNQYARLKPVHSGTRYTHSTVCQMSLDHKQWSTFEVDQKRS